MRVLHFLGNLYETVLVLPLLQLCDVRISFKVNFPGFLHFIVSASLDPATANSIDLKKLIPLGFTLFPSRAGSSFLAGPQRPLWNPKLGDSFILYQRNKEDWTGILPYCVPIISEHQICPLCWVTFISI